MTFSSEQRFNASERLLLPERQDELIVFVASVLTLLSLAFGPDNITGEISIFERLARVIWHGDGEDPEDSLVSSSLSLVTSLSSLRDSH